LERLVVKEPGKLGLLTRGQPRTDLQPNGGINVTQATYLILRRFRRKNTVHIEKPTRRS
jgi:hypothetical protein